MNHENGDIASVGKNSDEFVYFCTLKFSIVYLTYEERSQNPIVAQFLLVLWENVLCKIFFLFGPLFLKQKISQNFKNFWCEWGSVWRWVVEKWLFFVISPNCQMIRVCSHTELLSCITVSRVWQLSATFLLTVSLSLLCKPLTIIPFHFPLLSSLKYFLKK